MPLNQTNKMLAGKPLTTMSIGCMRWNGPDHVTEIVHECLDNGVLYLDTSPMYCFRSEEENSERWVGRAIKGIREKVILSAKCSPGNGGTEIGEFNMANGFSIQTADQLRKTLEQSLRRLDVDKLDCYQMWTVSNDLVYDSAFVKGGWLEGAMKAKEEGLFQHFGITGHPDNAMIKRWVDDGIFEMMTVPFNMLNMSRIEGIDYAQSKGMQVIAMNPLNGGMFGGDIVLDIPALASMGIELENATEMSLKFVEAFGVSALCGLTTLDHAKSDIKYLSKPKWTREQAMQVMDAFNNVFVGRDKTCTQCGYCKPCPVDLCFPDMFKMKDYYEVLKFENAKDQLKNMSKWYGDGFKLERCQKCGVCETRCPNQLPIMKMIDETLEIIRG